MITNKDIRVGGFVSHTSKYGMGKESGRVIAEAGNRYGRRYVWINYTIKATGKTYNSAFWDNVLVISSTKTIVYPGLTSKPAGDRLIS